MPSAPATLREDLLPFPFLRVVDGRILFANPAASALGFAEDIPLTDFSAELARADHLARTERRVIHVPEFECLIEDKLRVLTAVVEPLDRHETRSGASSSDTAGSAAPGRIIPDIGVFLTDHTMTSDLTNDLAQSVIDAEVANRRLDRTVSVLFVLAHLSSELMQATTETEARDLLERALASTQLFTRVQVVAPQSGALERIALPTEIRVETERLMAGEGPDAGVRIDAFLMLPVRGRDRVHAVIVGASSAPEQPTVDEDEPDLDLKPFASLTAFTIDNILLYRDLIESLQDLSFRNRAARELQQAMTQQELEARLGDLLKSYLGVSWFGLIMGATDRNYPDELDAPIRAALRGELTIADLPEATAICVPVRLTGPLASPEQEVFSVFAVMAERPEVLRGRGRESLLALADIAAVRLRNVRMVNDLRAHTVAVQYLNEELSRTVADLKSANEMKSRFVSIVSHEFRTPLTSISCYVDTLLAEVGMLDPDTSRQFLNVIRDESERLTRLINQLLDLSRIQARNRPLVSNPVNTADLAQNIVAALQPVAAKKSVALVLELPPTPATVPGDADGLYQVLLNIVGNGMRYTRPGGRVVIAVEEQPDFVYIRVTDTGIGIPADSLDAIFGEFYTVSQTRTRAAVAENEGLPDSTPGGSGTGLGLSIAKAIVEQHGGVIQVESRVGEGSKFTLLLPRKSGGS